ncbi:MAG: PEGA domain-containing protein [Myxococcota bacterium]
MRHSFPLLFVLGASLFFVSGSTWAQTGDQAGRWLVIPSSIGAEFAGGEADAEAVRAELVRRGLAAWPAARAAERFEVLGSAPAPQVSQSDINRWVERSRAAVRFLARADYKAARRELKAAQRLADRAAAELNREAARAQQVLDTCLFMVRAYVETRNGTEARRQARECRRLVPRVEPTAFRHTPEVRDLLAEVDREMASEAPGSLVVRSTPENCLVRINGVKFGQTPLRDIELPVGTYRLQVECEPEQRGRIHRVAIESGENQVTINVPLDGAVRTRPALGLAYATADDGSRARMGDAAEIGRTLETERVLVVTQVAPDQVRIDMDDAGRAASVWLGKHSGTLPIEEVRRGVGALLDGRSVDFSSANPTARASWATDSGPLEDNGQTATDGLPKSEATVPARPRRQRIAGWSLVAVGLGSLGASVGLHVRRGTLGDRFIDAPADLGAAQSWQNLRVPVWALAGVGGASMTATMPLVLPNRPRTPWWGWTLGAAGLGLSAYAIYEGVTMTNCPSPFITNASAVERCVDRGQQAGRVALATASAAPLLSVPLVYLFRPLRMKPSVAMNLTGATLSLRRSF